MVDGLSGRTSGSLARGVERCGLRSRPRQAGVAHLEAYPLKPSQQLDPGAAPDEGDPFVEIAELLERHDPSGSGFAIRSHYTVELNRVFNKTQEYFVVRQPKEVP